MTLVGVVLWVTMQIMFSGFLKTRTKIDDLPPTVKDTSPEALARAAKTEGSFNPIIKAKKSSRNNPRTPKHMELLNRRSEKEEIADLPVDDFDDLNLIGGIKTWGCGISTFPLFFYHIPKTGGGTVRSLLRKTIKEHDVPICWQCTSLPQGINNCLEKSLDAIGQNCRDKLPPLQRANHRMMKAWTEGLVMGHYNLGAEYAIWPAGGPREAHRVVQLREPVERMRSLFMFGQGKPQDLLKYVKKYDLINQVELAKKLKVPEAKLKGLSLAIIRVCGQTCPGLIASGQMTPRGALERAKSNLRTQFTVVGVSEEMDLFFKMLARRFTYLSTMEGIPGDQLVRHKADPELKEAFNAELNKPDAVEAIAQSAVLQAEAELYDVAIQVMRSQWAELEKCPNDTPYQPPTEEDTKGEKQKEEEKSSKGETKDKVAQEEEGVDEDAPEEDR